MTKSRPWYKKWWGVIIVILILPYFLVWFIWAKLKWSRTLKISATAVLIVLCVLDVVWFSSWASTQPIQPVASRTTTSTHQAQPASSNTTAVACQKPSTPVSAQSTYTNANQIIQVLATHNVPCSNVVTDTGISSFTGATSGVWVETAPGDSTAQFSGSENAGTDTEIVVFQNHADAVAYTNIGGGDTSHQSILGTNWAIDAAAPAVASINAALGTSSLSSTSKPTPVATTKPSTPVLTGFGATQDEWNKTHTADPQATANSSYDRGEGTSDCSNFGDRYYGMTGTTDYSMCFPSGQSLATTQSEVMQEFPSDTTILWQGKQTSGEPDECYQMEVHSATLASALNDDGDAFVEFQTLDPNNSTGNIEYNASNVNDAMLMQEDNASLSTASGC
jgi:hypothetical protein